MKKMDIKKIGIILAILFVIAAAVVTVIIVRKKTIPVYDESLDIIAEVGSPQLIALDALIKDNICENKECTYDVSKVKREVLGKYEYTIKTKESFRYGNITIVDTTAPSFDYENNVIIQSGDTDLTHIIKNCKDYSGDCTITLKNKEDEKLFSEVGTHSTIVLISDPKDNVKQLEVTFIVE